MSEIKLDETPTLTFEPFIEETQPPAREQKKQVTETAQFLMTVCSAMKRRRWLRILPRRLILPIPHR